MIDGMSKKKDKTILSLVNLLTPKIKKTYINAFIIHNMINLSIIFGIRLCLIKSKFLHLLQQSSKQEV
jgi:hypothetical protein